MDWHIKTIQNLKSTLPMQSHVLLFRFEPTNAMPLDRMNAYNRVMEGWNATSQAEKLREVFGKDGFRRGQVFG